MRYRFLFQPITGTFDLKRVPDEIQGDGGGTATQGLIALDNNAELLMLQELNVTDTGDVIIFSGSQLTIAEV